MQSIRIVTKVATNPRTPSLLVALTFLITFSLQPYFPIGSILAVLTGLGTLYIWSNMLTMHTVHNQFNVNKDNLEVMISRLSQEAVTNIAARTIQNTTGINIEPNLKETYTKIGRLFEDENIRHIGDIQLYLNAVERRNILYHRLHKLTALIGFVCMVGGASMEIAGNADSISASTNTTCIPGNTTTPPVTQASGFPFIKVGSGVFSFGFGSCAFAYFVLDYLISYQLDSLLLLLRAVKDEDTQQAQPVQRTPSLLVTEMRDEEDLPLPDTAKFKRIPPAPSTELLTGVASDRRSSMEKALEGAPRRLTPPGTVAAKRTPPNSPSSSNKNAKDSATIDLEMQSATDGGESPRSSSPK